MRMPNGYGSIAKLSGKRRNPYIVRVTAGLDEDTHDYVRRVLGYYKTRKEALEALAAYHKDPNDLTTANATFADIYNRWSAQHYKTIGESAERIYRAAYKSCVDLNNMLFKDVRLTHLQAVVDNSGKRYPSRMRIKNLLTQMYNFAIKYDIASRNYGALVDIGRPEPKAAAHKPFTPEEIDLLWQHVDMPNVDTALILIYTGMRAGELLSMRTEDVHLDDRYMVGGSKTDAGRNRIIPIHHRIVPLIRARLSSDNVYLISPHTDIRRYQETFAAIVKAAGVDLSHRSHDCRHTFASMMDAAGANRTALKRILGHASGDVTDAVYIHKAVSELCTEVDRLK